MKYFTSGIALLALFGSQMETASALQIQQKFTDDLVKSLAEEMNKDAEKETESNEEAKGETKDEKKTAKTEKKEQKLVQKEGDAKTNPKKEEKKSAKLAATKPVKKEKKEEEEIPMDNAAIKAYSSVIADAAEDSEPQTPVTYSQTIPDEERTEKQHTAVLGLDPMGSMIQNEISSIKEASIKAAQETD